MRTIHTINNHINNHIRNNHIILTERLIKINRSSQGNPIIIKILHDKKDVQFYINDAEQFLKNVVIVWYLNYSGQSCIISIIFLIIYSFRLTSKGDEECVASWARFFSAEERRGGGASRTRVGMTLISAVPCGSIAEKRPTDRASMFLDLLTLLSSSRLTSSDHLTLISSVLRWNCAHFASISVKGDMSDIWQLWMHVGQYIGCTSYVYLFNNKTRFNFIGRTNPCNHAIPWRGSFSVYNIANRQWHTSRTMHPLYRQCCAQSSEQTAPWFNVVHALNDFNFILNKNCVLCVCRLYYLNILIPFTPPL